MAGKKRQAKDVVPEEEGESDLDSSSSGEDDDYPEVGSEYSRCFATHMQTPSKHSDHPPPLGV